MSGTSSVAQEVKCLTMELKWKILQEYNLSEVCEQGIPSRAYIFGTEVVFRRFSVKCVNVSFFMLMYCYFCIFKIGIRPGQLWVCSPQNAVYTPVLVWKSQKNCSNIISYLKKLNFNLLNVLYFRQNEPLLQN